MIFLDAFSSRYLTPQKAPFLYKLSQEGYYTPLKSMFAFTGIGAAIFSGTSLNTNKVWCDYIFNSQPKPTPKLFKLVLKLCDLIPDDILSQYARYPIYRLFHQSFGIPNLIPPDLLDYFELRQAKKFTEEKALGQIPTLFDVLRAHSISYYVSGLYESPFDEAVMRKAFKILRDDYRVVLLKLGALDKLGHKYGPESKKVARKVLEIDEFITRFAEKSSQPKEKIYFIIFSDHGMSPVHKTVNILEMLKKIPAKRESDYFLFLNSTVVSFWFNNQRTKRLIFDMLRENVFGEVLDEVKLKNLEINKVGSEYGELLFALKEGNVFFPDFYRRHTPPKGMHGYAYPSYDAPILLVYSPNSGANFERKETVQHTDILPTILDLLNIPIPSTCEGKSLLKKD